MLHVMETGDREMVRQCLKSGTRFGIVLVRSEDVAGEPEPYLVGTAVRIESVEALNDGSLSVRVEGERRFRIRRLDHSRAYLVGYVEPVEDQAVEDSPRSHALIQRARECVREYVESTFRQADVRVTGVRLPSDPTKLSFVVANVLPAEEIDKQHLLEVTDTLERVRALIPLLEQRIAESQEPTYYRLTRADFDEWVNPN